MFIHIKICTPTFIIKNILWINEILSARGTLLLTWYLGYSLFWSVKQLLLKKVVEQHVKNFVEPREFCAMGSALLNCRTEAETPGHCNLANKDSCIELLVLIERGLGTWRWSWNRSPTSGELQVPLDEINFHKLNQRSSTWRSSLMITKKSLWQIDFHVEEESLEFIIVLSCKIAAEKFTRTDLSCSWLGHSFFMTMLART